MGRLAEMQRKLLEVCVRSDSRCGTLGQTPNNESLVVAWPSCCVVSFVANTGHPSSVANDGTRSNGDGKREPPLVR